VDSVTNLTINLFDTEIELGSKIASLLKLPTNRPER